MVTNSRGLDRFKLNYSPNYEDYGYSQDAQKTKGLSGWDKAKIGAQVVGAGSGLANAYLGFKNYQMAKEQFENEKRFGLANFNAQAQLTNNAIQNRADVGLALMGNNATPDVRQETDRKVKEQLIQKL